MLSLAQEGHHGFDDHDYREYHDEYLDHYDDAHHPYGYSEHEDYGYDHALHDAHNDAEANLYHSWPVYSPYAPHDWELHRKEPRQHTFDDYEEYDEHPIHQNYLPEEDGLDFVSGLRRMSFEGLKDADRGT